LRFTVLASGSAGNASLLEADGFTLLLDAGLGPRQLAERLAAVGSSWPKVRAVLLTHTHSDHWNERTLLYLHRHRVPLFCHADHQRSLTAYSPAFPCLLRENLVRTYEADQDFMVSATLNCRPLRLRHDGGLTFGFRFEGPLDFYRQPCALAYAADLGSWHPELARSLADVDVLALEFNHDVDLERASNRSPRLIARVLGDDGHLSNAQAAALLREVVRLSAPGRLQHVVQLHLSRDCNRPALAAETARRTLAEANAAVTVHTARQDEPGPWLDVGVSANGIPRPRSRPRRARPTASSQAMNSQPWLPGW
jgi:ribonuclease BN (tRNA processing enzyme)